MQSSPRIFIRSLLCSGSVAAPLAALGVAVASLAPVAFGPAEAVAAPLALVDRSEENDVARWSDRIWNAAKSGDLQAVERALQEVPDSADPADSKRLRDFISSRTKHVDEGTKTRDDDRAKALEALKAEVGKNEITKALTEAVKLQTLSDDWTAALALPEIRDLIAKSEVAREDAAKAGDWLVAQEILFRLRTLHDETGDAASFRRYDALLDEVNKRITLLAQYAPRELWRLRKAYADRVDPSKPFPEFNEAFADDWKESLEGISKGMLTSAMMTAADYHISAGGWDPLVKGGLDAVRVVATTEALKENFPGLADEAKRQLLVDAVNRNIEGLTRMGADAVGRPQFQSALRDLLEANKQGPGLPLEVVFREFGDGALEELSKRFEDEYTQVIWPEQLRRFEQMVKGNFVGVGVLIRHDDRRDIQIVNPLEGSPASRGGVKSEDRIVAVDGVPTVGWTLNKAVDSITGPAGKDVKLTLKRDGAEEPFDVALTREEIKIRSVNGWWKKALDAKGQPLWDWYVDADAGIGYVRLTSFNEDSYDDFRAAVREMRAERPLNGLILDLRHNPGGLLTGARDFSNAFVERGKLVGMQDRDGNQEWPMYAEPQRAIYKDLPLVVLVNQGSASASEIVSGVLKAYDRAVIIGDRSFGKGSVQTVYPCGDQKANAQLKVTIQYYLIPPGPGETEPRLVHKKPGATDWGVNPDLVVKMTPDQIEKSLTLRQNADVIQEWRDESDKKERPNVEDLLTKGIDPQLELALLVLQAKSLKQSDAAAQAAATERVGSAPQGG